MDYRSAESDNLDPLEFLIPKVKKTDSKKIKEKNYIPDFSKQPEIQLVKKYFKAKSTKQISTEATDGASYTSVVINKTLKKTPKQNQRINNNYREKTHEIPLIKVTVIPKSVETQTLRTVNKRKQIIKRVQSTISNQDSSVFTKNIYLVVSGRKTDKIYEIKTTGSERFSSYQSVNRFRYEDVSLQQVSNYKRIIESLGMDKKKKEKNRKHLLESSRESRTALVNEIFGGGSFNLTECACLNTRKKEETNNIYSRKSRVRIIGQLGVTDEDQYILNYTAATEHSPIVNNFTHVEQKLLPQDTAFSRNPKQEFVNINSGCCTNDCIYNKYVRNQRDSNVQANLLEMSTYRPSVKNNDIRCESQAVQVDLNKCILKDKLKKNKTKDQTLHCSCNRSNTGDLVSTSAGDENKGSIRESKSPVVIISVYPKSGPSTSVSSHTIVNQRSSPPRSIESNAKRLKKDTKSKNDKKIYISQSPSPSGKIFTKENPLSRTINARFLSTNRKKKNTNFQASSIMHTNKKPTKTEDLCRNNVKLKSKTELNKKIPINIKCLDSKETNTERVIKKKILVDNNKKAGTRSKKRDSFNNSFVPHNKNSRLLVNINEENGKFDVLWHPRNSSRHLRVRKTYNDQESQKSSDYERVSMENYLMLSDDTDTKSWSLSQAFRRPRSRSSDTRSYETSRHSYQDYIDSGQETPRIGFKVTQTSHSCDKLYGSECFTQFYAPIKHYHGDNCNVSNPLERDKEIRELLEIQQCRPTVSKSITQDYLSGIFCRNTRYKQCCDLKKIVACISSTSECKCCKVDRKTTKNSQCKLVKTKTTTTQYELKTRSPPPPTPPSKIPPLPTPPSKIPPHPTPLSKVPPPPKKQKCNEGQLILNRNIQVYLQIEQFTKQKPIMLTRKQYEKLKKTIKNTVKIKKSKSDKSKDALKSSVSVGQVKKKGKQSTGDIENKGVQAVKLIKLEKKPSNVKNSASMNDIIFKDSKGKPQQKQATKKQCTCLDTNTSSIGSINKKAVKMCMLLKNQEKRESGNNPFENVPKQAVSSLEIRYANIAYKRVTFSTTNFAPYVCETSYTSRKDSRSLQTLFKGSQIPMTPNLDTSIYSQYSEPRSDPSKQSIKYLLSPCSKPKRPLLRRLMSCLVMHSVRASKVKINDVPTNKLSDVNSSIDSYYISSSLGAIEVTSSLYDTSASFYSNHTIVPVNKMKKGFLSSVRGFLTSRKS